MATILGWELKRVEEIARRYVTGEAIGMGMIARLQDAQNRKPTVKPHAKRASEDVRNGSNAVRAVAGELGLEPRMTVPKTVVLPLHHSPAGSAFPQRLCGGGGQIGQTDLGCNTLFQDYFRSVRRRSKWVLAASRTHGYKPRPHFGATPCGPSPRSECGSAW